MLLWYTYSVPYLTFDPNEIADNDESDAQDNFMTRVPEKLGSWVLHRELEDIGLKMTSQYSPYEDETQN